MLNKTYPSLSTCSKIPAYLSTLLWSPWSKIPRLYPTCNEKSLSRPTHPYLPPVIKIYHFFCCHHCMVTPSWNIYPFLLPQFEKILLSDGIKALEYLPSFLLSNRESVGLESVKKFRLHQKRSLNDTQLMKDCLYQIGIKMHICPTFIGLVGLFC